jgi:hypothetical protein
MSDLLNDSPTAVTFRDRILAELHSGEKVLYAADGQVKEPHGGSDYALYIGSIIVTSERLLVVESKMRGRAAFYSVAWTDVVTTGRGNDGTVGVQTNVTSRSRWPIWEIKIWEGKSWTTPLDKVRLDLVSFSIQEGLAAVQAAEGADTLSAYEELKKRRGN